MKNERKTGHHGTLGLDRTLSKWYVVYKIRGIEYTDFMCVYNYSYVAMHIDTLRKRNETIVIIDIFKTEEG